jgi:Cys-tRNA(Pro)/Cys-tRNA(Cys) deacylase
VIADETIVLWDAISISAGQRGLQIIIAPDDYVRATKATLAEISHEKK